MHGAEEDRIDKTTDVGIGVTLATFGLRWNMIRGLGYGDRSVMTGSTIVVIYTHVIERRAGKVDIVTYYVTRRAVARGRQVIQRHTGGDVTIVTHGAISRVDTGMVEYRALEARGT